MQFRNIATLNKRASNRCWHNLKFRFFEPPLGNPESRASWSLWDAATKSTSPYWIQARSNLNVWLSAWPAETDAELLGRLKSDQDDQFQGAIWELYVSWFLVSNGFLVKRLKIGSTDRLPDFEVTKFEQTFFVEATAITEIRDKNFDLILEQLNQTAAIDYFLGISVEERSKEIPDIEQLQQKVTAFLDSVRIGEFKSSSATGLPFGQISQNGWGFSVSAFENKTGRDNLGQIGISSGQQVIEIKDDLKLLRKLEEKATRYDSKYQPLVIAVGEHAFRVAEAHEHRFSALFGKRELHFQKQKYLGERRSGKGFWGPGLIPQNVPALLLGNRLDPSKGEAQSLEIWLAPDAPDNWIGLFENLVAYCQKGIQYGKKL